MFAIFRKKCALLLLMIFSLGSSSHCNGMFTTAAILVSYVPTMISFASIGGIAAYGTYMTSLARGQEELKKGQEGLKKGLEKGLREAAQDRASKFRANAADREQYKQEIKDVVIAGQKATEHQFSTIAGQMQDFQAQAGANQQKTQQKFVSLSEELEDFKQKNLEQNNQMRVLIKAVKSGNETKQHQIIENLKSQGHTINSIQNKLLDHSVQLSSMNTGIQKNGNLINQLLDEQKFLTNKVGDQEARLANIKDQLGIFRNEFSQFREQQTSTLRETQMGVNQLLAFTKGYKPSQPQLLEPVDSIPAIQPVSQMSKGPNTHRPRRLSVGLAVDALLRFCDRVNNN